MKYLAFGFLLVGLGGLSYAVAESVTQAPPLSDPGLEAVLQKQIDPENGVQLQSSIQSDLESSLAGEERVVIWTLLGPTFWSNHLSVLTEKNGQWQLLATLSLGGAEATLAAVTTDGLITVNAKTPGPNDPVCCPSQVKTLHYRYAKGQLIEAGAGRPGGKP